MPDMLAQPSVELRPSFYQDSAENGAKTVTLPAGELGSFLCLVTPTGAPALHFALWGVRFGVEPYPLPLTKPRAPCPDWLRWELENRLRFKSVPLKHDDIDLLVELLAPGPPRPDMLPAYRPHGWRVEHQQTPTGRRCTMARYIAAAVAYDLGGYELSEVSAKVLGLHDHEQRRAGEPAKASEFRRFGRGLLAVLGVWPWVHAESGKLLKRWRADQSFLEPLRVWHERACSEREQELARCRWAFAEGHRLSRREDPLKLPPEGTRLKPSQPQLPEHHLNASEIRQQEDAMRALDVFQAEQDKLLADREEARKARRPMR
jgi:hypothetical protein